MKRVAVITEHLATGGMPAVIYNEAKFNPEYEYHIFCDGYNTGSVQVKQLNELSNVTLHHWCEGNICREIQLLGVRFVVQHDTSIAGSQLIENGIKLVRVIHSTYGWAGSLFNPDADYYLGVSPLVVHKIKERTNQPVGLIHTGIDTERFKPATLTETADLREKYMIPLNKFVILHVGIWSPNKAQHRLIEAHKRLTGIAHSYPIETIFLGGRYENFKDYWSAHQHACYGEDEESIRVLEETDTPEHFYQLADLFVNTSHVEGCCVAIREAAACGLPVVAWGNDGNYSSFETAPFQWVSDQQELIDEIQMAHALGDRQLRATGRNCRSWILQHYGMDTFISEMQSVYERFDGEGEVRGNAIIESSIGVNNGVCLDFKTSRNTKIGFRALGDEQYWQHQTDAKAGEELWIGLKGHDWYTPYWLQILENGKVIEESQLSLAGKDVFIKFESGSLGDTLAWLPAVIAFERQHNCRVRVFTHYNHFLTTVLPNMTFVQGDYEADFQYRVGCFDSGHKRNWRTIGLSEVAMDILGVHQVEPLRFELDLQSWLQNAKLPLIEDKSIVFAPDATTKGKGWQYTNGWQELADYFHGEGFTPIVIGENAPFLQNALNFDGKQNLYDLAHICAIADAVIGVSSGLSWLAQASGAKVLMLNTCTYDWNEAGFRHVGRNDVCRGCWNRTEFPLDKSVNWCPAGLDFQCSRYLTPEMVIERFRDDLDIFPKYAG